MLRLIAFVLSAFFAISTAYAQDVGLSNAARRAPYYDGLKGKTVVFVPLAMGFDLTEGWAAIMRRQAADLGYKFEIRDPNWSTDAGTRALTSLIAQKPDLVIVHNPDVQSYSRPIKRLEQAGIKVLQVNLESSLATDSYVGADWVKVGYVEADALVKQCGPGTSGKVAIMQGVPTAASNLYELFAYHDVFGKHPNMKIVSEQAANYDPAKERAIMETVLQQNPDLCGVVGNWDNQDVGAGAAIQQAGKTGKVYVVTSGGGTKDGCDNIRKGLLDMTVSYNVPLQGDILNQQIVELLLSPAKAGTVKNTYYTPLTILTKDNLTPRNCWSLSELK
ncbi:MULTISPECIES: sugar ABC transporter substrate-binding protein [unclassified Acidisoma]|jgi:ribose transport system substrate-binding protein|uniref:sugar ABC transporter substrate-binding protein n=1 Tax=unclassified Acidisoma TaxID=2634065 RepID=UPI00131B127C|nr:MULTISPECIES: sugar ABC transporter substrate-binding protein [unclassified Acidisoma]